MGCIIDEPGQAEEQLLACDVPDEALERLAGSGAEPAANPTVPSAIICIPFEA